MAALLAAADIAVVPSVRDDAGNVDGLPNVVMEALASGTPLVATHSRRHSVRRRRTGARAGSSPSAMPGPSQAAIDGLLADPHARAAIGSAARADVLRRRTWPMVAEAFEQVYDRAAGRAESRRKTD